MIVAGIGSKKDVTKDQVLAAICAALTMHGLETSQIEAIAVPELKSDDPGIREAARELGLVVMVVSREDLEREAGRTLSHSQLSIDATGVPSASEASALSAAGDSARLLGPRIAVGPATCALAISEAAR